MMRKVVYKSRILAIKIAKSLERKKYKKRNEIWKKLLLKNIFQILFCGEKWVLRSTMKKMKI